MQIQLRIVAAQPIETVRRDFALTEQEAKELDLLGRYLRAETIRRPALKLLKELSVSFEDVKNWHHDWNECWYARLWRQVFGEPSADDFDKIRSLASDGTPVDLRLKLQQVETEQSKTEIANLYPQVPPDVVQKCAEAAVAEFNKQHLANSKVAVVCDGDTIQFKRASFRFEYMPPVLSFYVEPQKFQLNQIVLTRRIVRIGTESALKAGFGERIKLFVEIVNKNESRKKREERLRTEAIQRDDILRATADKESYCQLVRKFETSLGRWCRHYNSNPGLTNPGVYRIFIKNSSELSAEKPVGDLPLQEWDELIASTEIVQDQFRTRGFQLVRSDKIDAPSKRQEYILFPCADKYLAVAALGCSGLDNRALTDVLKTLDATYPFVLVACGEGLLEGKLVEPIPDATDLAQQISNYCSEVLDYGTATVTELAKEIEHTQRFWLYFNVV